MSTRRLLVLITGICASGVAFVALLHLLRGMRG